MISVIGVCFCNAETNCGRCFVMCAGCSCFRHTRSSDVFVIL